MKHILFTIFTVLLGIAVSGCDKNEPTGPSIEAINLNFTSLTLAPGESCTLTAETEPADAEGVVFSWKSDDETVASVNDQGTVTGVAIGQTSISVSCGNVNATCSVSVTEEGSTIESITITPNPVEVLIGETVTLNTEILPAGGNYTVTWKSYNEDIATVDTDGTVTGIASGNVIIMAESDGKTADCMVSVVGVPVESITLDTHELEMQEMDVTTLRGTVLPENADNKTITWTSSNETVAVVNGAGTVTAMGAGEAVITAKAGNKTDQCHITVTALPLAVGHFYYSDGTWSAQLDGGKDVIGVVFYVGDITATDKALAKEHPSCTHGLVVSLNESEGSFWQQEYLSYNNTVGSWIESNISDYETITTGTEADDNLNVPMGYNNTKAIEAFNAASENSQWPVSAMEYVLTCREEYPAPESSSDWYLGSAKEMSLLATGEYDGNIWDIRDSGAPIKNLETVNESLSKVPDACLIGVLGLELTSPQMQFYWTSTEIDYQYAIVMTAINGQMPQAIKGEGGYRMFSIRPILAF